MEDFQNSHFHECCCSGISCITLNPDLGPWRLGESDAWACCKRRTISATAGLIKEVGGRILGTEDVKSVNGDVLKLLRF